MSWLYVFVGGGLGSLCRYGIGRWLTTAEQTFPYGTVVANIIACLLVGMIAGYSTRLGWDKNLQLLMIVGFCGGFSTFSAFSLDTVQIWSAGHYINAALNIVISVVVCVVCVLVGMRLANL